MQIYVVENHPNAIAKSLCDKHVLSQILTTAEALAIAHIRNYELPPPFNVLAPSSHFVNHAWPKWVSETKGNYIWTLKYALALCTEYTERYDDEHAVEQDILRMEIPPFPLLTMNDPQTLQPVVMPTMYIVSNSVMLSYRQYYQFKATKMRMTWMKGNKPAWIDLLDIKRPFFKPVRTVSAYS